MHARGRARRDECDVRMVSRDTTLSEEERKRQQAVRETMSEILDRESETTRVRGRKSETEPSHVLPFLRSGSSSCSTGTFLGHSSHGSGHTIAHAAQRP